MISMKGKTYYLTAFVLIVIMFLCLVPTSIADTNTENVRVVLNGPPVLGTLMSDEFAATIIDPENREWDYKVFITSDNTTGASPLESEPVNGTVSPGNDTFGFNVTGMQEPGTLEIHVNCSSGTSYYEKVQPIVVVKPILFSINLNNPSNVIIKNATVQFLVDGIEIDKQVIQSIGARQSDTITSSWITPDPELGWHDSTILVDLNGDGIIDTDAGDMMVEERFFVEGGSDWVFNITLLVGLLALIIGFVLISRRKIR